MTDVRTASTTRPKPVANAGISRPTGAAGILVLILVALLTVWDQVPPAPAPADAPAGQFSAERAHRQIEQFAAQPHPLGTAEHARVRGYLVDELRALGLDPLVQDSIGVPPDTLGEFTGLVPVARVRNIVTVIEGSDPSGQILLAAHYDSVPSGPGANDDGSGVATILEVARALTHDGTRPRNDIVLLITDGEEDGLLGAQAFTRDHPIAADGGIVLNHESRGSSGPVMMFRATPGAAALTGLFADVAPHPSADSTTATIFEFMSNDTDFTAFRAAGFTAMDLAYAGGGAHYHSILDSPEHVDRRSLQQMGANTLAMTRALAQADLAEFTASGGNAVYFNVPPGLLVHLAAGWAWVLAAFSVVLTLAVIALARVRRDPTIHGPKASPASKALTIPLVFAGLAAVLVLLGLTVAAGALYWTLLVRVRPGFGSLLTGTPWEPLWLQASAVALAVTLLALWYAVVRRLGSWALWSGALLLLTALGVAGVVVSPQLAPILVPAPFAALGGLVALALPAPVWRTVALTLGLVPTAMFLLAAGWISFETGLADGMYFALPMITLSLVLTIPLADTPRARWRRLLLVPGLAAAVTAALTGLGVAANAAGATRPDPTRLTYTLDADTGRATWAVPVRPDSPAASTGLDAWASGYVGSEVTDNPVPDPWRPLARVGPADPAELAPPRLEVIEDETAGAVRTVRLALSSPRGAEGLLLAVDDPDGRVSAIVAEGREITPAPQDGTVGVHLHAFDGPVEVELRFDAAGPLPVRLADVDRLPSALDGLPGYTAPPDELYLSHSWLTVTTSHSL